MQTISERQCSSPLTLALLWSFSGGESICVVPGVDVAFNLLESVDSHMVALPDRVSGYKGVLFSEL